MQESLLLEAAKREYQKKGNTKGGEKMKARKFSWNMISYFPAYVFSSEDCRLTMGEVQNVFQLIPAPPEMENSNDCIHPPVINCFQRMIICQFTVRSSLLISNLSARSPVFVSRSQSATVFGMPDIGC